LAHGGNRCPHGCAGCQAVVDEDHALGLHPGRWSVAPKRLFPPPQLLLFRFHDGIDGFPGNGQPPKQILIQDLDSAGGNGAHGEFLVPWQTQLAHQQHVQGRREGGGDFESNRYAPPG
jgi:hypothetical protein